MKNKLTDLNDHLFAQMERLNDEDLKGEQLEREVARSKAMTAVSREIIDNASLALDAAVKVHDLGIKNPLPMLEDKSQ